MLAALGAMLGGSASAGKAAQLSEMLVSARAIAATFENFAAVTLEEYKDVAKGPTYYDTVDEVSAAVEQAEDEGKRVRPAPDHDQLVPACFPWGCLAHRRSTTIASPFRLCGPSGLQHSRVGLVAPPATRLLILHGEQR